MIRSDNDPDEPSGGRLTNLHAKVFVVDRDPLAHLFVGSANATESGLSANVEFPCELIGPVSKIGVDALVGKDAPFREMLTPYVASDIEPGPDESDTVGRKLDHLLMDIAGKVQFRTTLTVCADGWAPRITAETALPLIPEGMLLTIGAHNRPAEVFSLNSSESIEIELAPRALEGVTAFLRLTARQAVNGATIERSAVVCSILDGAPDDRFEEIVARQIDTPEKFMKFLALLLGLAWGGSAGTSSTDGVSAAWSAGLGQGVLELLARALSERPEAIDHLASIVDRLRRPSNGKIVLPPGWDDV